MRNIRDTIFIFQMINLGACSCDYAVEDCERIFEILLRIQRIRIIIQRV